MKFKKMGHPPLENTAIERLPMVRITPNQLTACKAADVRSANAFSIWVRGVLDRAS